MNQENRQKVLNYCAEYDTYPLYFNDYESDKEEFDPSKYSIESMVKRALELTEEYASYNANTDDYECSKSRSRSSLDIWRHIIYYYPTVEIFDVMHVLYDLHPKDLHGLFCNDVQRRVFKIRKDDECRCSTCITNYQTASAMRTYLYSGRTTDEYGLDWEDWKDI